MSAPAQGAATIKAYKKTAGHAGGGGFCWQYFLRLRRGRSPSPRLAGT